MAFANPYAPVVSQVMLPFSNPIPGGLTYGKQIQIQGVVQDYAGADGKMRGYHLPETPSEILVYLRKEGTLFAMKIVHVQFGMDFTYFPSVYGWRYCQKCILQIAVNGKHFTDFKHRFPIEKISYVLIDGSYMQINFVKFEGGETHGAVHGAEHGYPSTAAVYQQPPPPYSPGGFSGQSAFKSKPVSGESVIYNPPVPFNLSVPGGTVPNRMIYMSAAPLPDAKRFTVNLKQGEGSNSNVVFHFDVRFSFGSDRSVIVRNTCSGGNWGPEERTVSHFPFLPNASFDMLILVESDKFKDIITLTNVVDRQLELFDRHGVLPPLLQVAINNFHFLDYKHRLPFHLATVFNVTGDIRISTVRFQ